MKKSEAVQIIEDALWGMTELNPEEKTLFAKQLLDYLLDAGMTPPEAEFQMKREISPGQEVTWFKKMRQWEEE